MNCVEIINNFLLKNETEYAEVYMINFIENTNIATYEIMVSASHKNYVNVIDFIIKYKLKYHYYDINRISVLFLMSASFNDINLMKILIKNPNIDPTYMANSATYIAFNNGHLKIVKELLQDSRVTSDPEIYTKFYEMILDLSFQQQLIFLLNVPQELCEIIQLFVFRNVY
jgi:hypothetical protein